MPDSSALNHIVLTDQDLADPQILEGWNFFSRQQFDAAADVLLKATSKKASRNLWGLLGLIWWHQHRPGLALTALTEELKYFPDNTWVFKVFVVMLNSLPFRAPRTREFETLIQLSKPGHTLVDIGSHVGNTAARLLGPDTRLLSVEPHTESFNLQSLRFRSSIARNDFYLEKLASGVTFARRLLWHHAEVLGDSHTVSLHWKNSFPSTYHTDSSEVVEVVPLSELLKAYAAKLAPYGVLKIDVEGSELETIQGTFPALPLELHPHTVAIEVHAAPQGGESLTEIIRLLSDSGYESFRMFGTWGLISISDSHWLARSAALHFDSSFWSGIDARVPQENPLVTLVATKGTKS